METAAFPTQNESMAEQQNPFHDFGLLPDGLAPPADKLRTFAGAGRVVAVYGVVYVLVALGLGLTAVFAGTTPLPLNVVGMTACLTSLAALVYLGTRNDYRWIELDGATLRARRLFTGAIIERPVEEIEALVTIHHLSRRGETRLLNKLYGRVKGIEIRFRDQRTPLRVYRTDPAMVNAQEFLEAVLYRMTQIGPLEADIAEVEGRPLVRSVRWRGGPPVATWKYADALRGIVLFAVLVLGVTLCYWHLQLQERVEVGSRPPHEVTLAQLLQHGPGENRHVTVTDFEAGGFAHGDKQDSWSQVWVVLQPKGQPSREIQAVLACQSVQDEVDLKQRLQQGRVTGVCSQAPSSRWGMTLGPNLVAANNDLPLHSAWLISEMRHPPRADVVEVLRILALGTFVVATVMSLVIVGRGIVLGR